MAARSSAGEKDAHGFGIATSMLTLLTVVLAFAALAVAGLAFSKSSDAEDSAAAANGPKVSETDFALTPASVAGGDVITVSNDGKVVHNLAIKGTDLITDDLQPGDTTTLGIGELADGTYEMYCEIPGHREAGMRGTLTVGSGGGGRDAHGGGSGSAGADDKTLLAGNDASDETMKEPVDAYVAQLEEGANTEGVGNVALEPTILADGTKEFALTAEVIDWEVEPGKKVRAWSYNGMVPGPLIRVNTGDKVRVVLDNQLPQSTSIHFHGIDVPNAMDGVPDVTQKPTKPGKQFVYEFVAKGPAVGMYHSHHHAEHQVPDGLLGAFIIDDLPVPAGVVVSQRLPMVLNDAGVIGLTLNGKSFPATAPLIAKQGEWVQIDYMSEGLQIHPMHLHGMPQLVIAKDGFPLAEPQWMDTVSVAPGERYSVLVQATHPGVWAWHCHILTHAERDTGMFGMVTTFIVQ